METLSFKYPATKLVARQAYVGVVGSGDLEILLEPSSGTMANVLVRTRYDGFAEVWRNVMDKFFDVNDIVAYIEINDFGATPGMVTMRLLQALEVSTNEENCGQLY